MQKVAQPIQEGAVTLKKEEREEKGEANEQVNIKEIV